MKASPMGLVGWLQVQGLSEVGPEVSPSKLLNMPPPRGLEKKLKEQLHKVTTDRLHTSPQDAERQRLS